MTVPHRALTAPGERPRLSVARPPPQPPRRPSIGATRDTTELAGEDFRHSATRGTNSPGEGFFTFFTPGLKPLLFTGRLSSLSQITYEIFKTTSLAPPATYLGRYIPYTCNRTPPAEIVKSLLPRSRGTQGPHTNRGKGSYDLQPLIGLELAFLIIFSFTHQLRTEVNFLFFLFCSSFYLYIYI